MKKIFLTSAVIAVALVASQARADGYDLTVKSIHELSTDASAPAAGDLTVRYDASADKFVKVDATTHTATSGNFTGSLKAPAEVTTTTNALSLTECGKTLTVSAATEFVTTLPALSLGCEFTIIVGAAPSGASYTIVTADNAETIRGKAFDMTGGLVAAGAGTAAADTITFVNGTALVGDRVDLWSDGINWHGIAFSSSSGAITYTSAQ